MPFRRRRTSSRARSGRPRRTREWFNWETINPTTGYHRPFLLGPGQSSTAFLITPNDAQEFYDEPTIVRLLIRQWLIAQPVTATVAFETHIWSGILVARDNGYGDPPDISVTRGDYDWLWWQSVHFSRLTNVFGTIPGMGVLSAEFGPQQGVIDVRAKRKIPQGFGLLYCNYVTGTPDYEAAAVMGYTSGRGLLLNG